MSNGTTGICIAVPNSIYAAFQSILAVEIRSVEDATVDLMAAYVAQRATTSTFRQRPPTRTRNTCKH